MTTLVDTSGLLALLDRDDPIDALATATWERLLFANEVLLTYTYAVIETFALVQRRLGLSAVRALNDVLVPLIEIVWVDRPRHEAAVADLLATQSRRVSLIDRVGFRLMRQLGLTSAFAFDADFAEEGFTTA